MTASFDSANAGLEQERSITPTFSGGQYPEGRHGADGPDIVSSTSVRGTFAAPGASSSGSATTEMAKQEAGEVAGTAKEAGQQVAESTKEQVGEVTAEAGRQARQLVDQVRTEVTDQAAFQQQRVAGGIRSLADELAGMAGHSEQDGPATDLARQAADRLHDVARWLDDREPGRVLDEVRSFARRRPGTYLAIAAGAGVLAGRLTRGLTAPQESTDTANGPTATHRVSVGSNGSAALGGTELAAAVAVAHPPAVPPVPPADQVLSSPPAPVSTYSARTVGVGSTIDDPRGGLTR